MPRPKRKREYGLGSIDRRPSGKFRARYRDQYGRRVPKYFSTMDLAQAWLRQKAAADERQDAELPPDPKATPRLSILADVWFADREGPANRNNASEQKKWKNHLLPELGHMRPDEVTTLHLRTLISRLLREGRLRTAGGKDKGTGLSSTYVLQLIRILGSLYTHLLEQGAATTNPTRLLPKATRRKIKPSYDWRNTPFLHALGDARRVYMTLPEPFNIAYAVGVMRGPRPGEIRALPWSNVDLEHRLITIDRQISGGKVGPPKGGRSRVVSISDELLPILAAWHLKTGGKGLVIPPEEGKLRWPFRGGKFIGDKALNRELAKALVALELPPLVWYQATRHTFGSHWVLQGGSLEKLALILGHSSSEVTKRYAHLRPELLGTADTARAQVDLSPGEVVALGAPRTEDIGAQLGPANKKKTTHREAKKSANSAT
jgi:integrase